MKTGKLYLAAKSRNIDIKYWTVPDSDTQIQSPTTEMLKVMRLGQNRN